MTRFPKSSIKRKVTTVIMRASIAVLLVTVASFMMYDLVTFRQAMVQNLFTQARTIADNTTAALAFRNENDAANVLSSLRTDNHITAAAIYDAHGKLFVKYPASFSDADLPRAPQRAGYQFGSSHLTLFQPVVQSGKHLGTLYLQADLTELTQRFELYGAICLFIMAGSLVVALWLSTTLQRRISNPIIALAETARNITGKRNFSVRAQKNGDDELGDLTEAFNTMLDQIQTSNADLEKSRAQLQIITDYASVMLCHVDRNQIFLFVNPAYAARFNLTPATVVGRNIRDVVGAQAYESFHHYVRKALAGERMEYELEIPYEKLGPRWMHCIYVPEKNAAGEVIGFVGVLNEITERKRAEEELKRARDQALAASRAKDDFLAALSHELRTPLSPVLLVASDAAGNPHLPPDTRAHFEMIRRNVELEARLIDDLLDLTRISRGKLSLDMRLLDVRAVLKDAIATVEAGAELKRIKLAFDFGAKQHMVLGDAVRLQQIFWNVLKNAVKFTPEGGKITIQTRTLEENIAVEIIDTGIGMVFEEILRVFDAFSQGDHAGAAGSHRFGGLGLGLAISRMLVELHGGTIHAASRGRGQGATFTVELACAEVGKKDYDDAPVEQPTTAHSPAELKKKSGLRILLVEDHEPTRTALMHLLTRRCFNVMAASSIAEARRLAHQGKIDLVISDIGLPDGTGYTLMAELRDNFGLKGIALTGYGTEQDIERSLAVGFVAHLTKPIHVQALEKVLANPELVRR
jgi:PAS domain S-box-containing protein